jgi:hypothetical protein
MKDAEDPGGAVSLDEPIIIGDQFRITDTHVIIEVLDMAIGEDGVTLVRLKEEEKTKTVRADDFFQRVTRGDLVRADD